VYHGAQNAWFVFRLSRRSKPASIDSLQASTLFLNGEPETARPIFLRDLVNATIGFEALALVIPTPPKSLHRMLSERVNPSMNNIAAIFSTIGKTLNVQITTNVVEAQETQRSLA
jgi:hypothetical protein